MKPEAGPAIATLIDGELAPGQPSARLVVPWWSFTKTVLSAAALRLVERGQLTLDDPLPEQRYTLRQLLQHTSGLRNYTNLKAYEPAVRCGDAPWAPEEMLERLAAELPPFEPGSTWAYSNAGYYIVRRHIERIADCPLEDALNRLVFSPLGVSGSFIAATAQDLDTCAWGNHTNYHPRWVYHGLLVGSAEAAAHTLHGIVSARLFSAGLVSEMRKPIPLGQEIPGRPGREFGYGMGMMVALDSRAGAYHGHTGADWTSVAAVYHFTGFTPARTVAAFLPGDREAEVEWVAVNTACDVNL
jgi:D-alanyl-D-alanine carboxypeptidase